MLQTVTHATQLSMHTVMFARAHAGQTLAACITAYRLHAPGHRTAAAAGGGGLPPLGIVPDLPPRAPPSEVMLVNHPSAEPTVSAYTA